MAFSVNDTSPAPANSPLLELNAIVRYSSRMFPPRGPRVSMVHERTLSILAGSLTSAMGLSGCLALNSTGSDVILD